MSPDPNETSRPEGPPAPEPESSRLAELPREAGVMLVAVGVLGFVMPAIAGIPALMAGGLVLWPRTFRPVERWVAGRFPATYREGMRQMDRYLDDLERRYPNSTRA
ncbi:hypothetical protein OJF2_08440 [Aquisphaera giovannonii]|uniref:Transmembrane protein (PGPGW) n=1 Tax=Aquisphaera giovannonii TaxID=406548 RepID=A0A5B9VWD5_9BACT|nr:hypothetical protein [Aquisphaera giovannonii]QEH32374.1 hypothetical protein OJF2_08440 [Aquisphaera giovannonii]